MTRVVKERAREEVGVRLQRQDDASSLCIPVAERRAGARQRGRTAGLAAPSCATWTEGHSLHSAAVLALSLSNATVPSCVGLRLAFALAQVTARSSTALQVHVHTLMSIFRERGGLPTSPSGRSFSALEVPASASGRGRLDRFLPRRKVAAHGLAHASRGLPHRSSHGLPAWHAGGLLHDKASSQVWRQRRDDRSSDHGCQTAAVWAA
mmetsp:Transcript_4349/g.12561  ORF Transcript_4349/g.12561 Transcript_4349/m.12561 type:complete len:208 (+) Transcript_4349:335-958(+)